MDRRVKHQRIIGTRSLDAVGSVSLSVSRYRTSEPSRCTFAGLRVVVELSSGNFECAEALLGLALDPAGFPVPCDASALR